MLNRVKIMQISGMEKVFADTVYKDKKEIESLTVLKGERISYQILYTRIDDGENQELEVSVDCDSRIGIQLRDVGLVPAYAVYKGSEHDDFFERKSAGLYPDVLEPNKGSIKCSECTHALYVTCSVPENIDAGTYEISLKFSNGENAEIKIMKLSVINCILPQQETIYTQWFHTDCIADYYNMDVFSEEHWDMVEKFVKTAVKTGITMILTPVFTPPLDTEVGGRRTAVQLVDVSYFDGKYTFGFDKLKRWIDMCRKNGIKQFEISHLFTQWGSGNAPLIIVKTENGFEEKFGWHTDAIGEEYAEFLGCFLTELTKFLKYENVYDVTYFHVSDEPNYEKDYKVYSAEYNIITKYVPADKIIDAMGDYNFVREGFAKNPIVVTDRIYGFLDKGTNVEWAYYCCCPAKEYYSNRLLGMSLGRTRIMGIQLYKYNIKGFLHWGYNFYNSRYSKRKINPFMITDADEEFPAGDSFSVYPGAEGPYESLRSEAFYMGLQDMRACKALESKIGREETIKVIEDAGEITLTKYPYSNDGITAIRDRINRKLQEIY